MYELLISEVAERNINEFSVDEKILIAEKLRYLAKNFELLKRTKKIRKLQGYDNYYRFIISRKIRAIFEVDGTNITILILRIGKRKNIYSDLKL